MCFVYDFQTLITGAVAIIVAIVAGVPVWRQLRDTNLQTRIVHRKTLADLLRDALNRYGRVDKSIRKPLEAAARLTTSPDGEPIKINSHDAHNLESMFYKILDWYLVILADTEHVDIEACKSNLKNEICKLEATLNDAHWADHNEQYDDTHSISDEDWVNTIARCAKAKLEASQCVCEVSSAYDSLQKAQNRWIRLLRKQISRLDQQIASHN